MHTPHIVIRRMSEKAQKWILLYQIVSTWVKVIQQQQQQQQQQQRLSPIAWIIIKFAES